MKSIRSELYQICSYQLNKVSLSPFDDKRYILSDGITSYAYGNKNNLLDAKKLIKKVNYRWKK